MTSGLRSPRRPTLLLVGMLALAACSSGGATSMQPSDGTTEPGPASPTAPVARTTPEVIADQNDLDGRPIAVTGFFTTNGTTHLVCDAILESYPPQCGGAVIEVLGTIPPEALAMLDSADEPGLAGVAWGGVEIRGTFHAAAGDARPTLELSEIRIVP